MHTRSWYWIKMLMVNWKNNRTYIVLMPKLIYPFLPPNIWVYRWKMHKNTSALFGLNFSDFPKNNFIFPTFILKSFQYRLKKFLNHSYIHHLDPTIVKILNICGVCVCVWDLLSYSLEEKCWATGSVGFHSFRFR